MLKDKGIGNRRTGRWTAFLGSVLPSSMAVLCALSLATSCHRRPLEDPSELTRVKVIINTDSIKNVTSDIYNDKIERQTIEPEAMHALFFKKDNDDVVSETFITNITTEPDGRRALTGDVYLPKGEYRMLIYDYGTEETIVKDFYHYSEALAYTDEAPYTVKSRFPTKTGETVGILNEPDHLMVSSNNSEVIPYHKDVHTIITEANTVVESWYIQIKVDGLKYVSSSQAVLSGLVSSNLIASNTRIDSPEASVWFKLQKSDDNGVPVICAIFNTFGRIPESTNNLTVSFNIITTDGRVVKCEYDISDLFLSENAIKHQWLLLEDTIHIDPPPQKGGFEPSVEDWEEENREIYL